MPYRCTSGSSGAPFANVRLANGIGCAMYNKGIVCTSGWVICALLGGRVIGTCIRGLLFSASPPTPNDLRDTSTIALDPWSSRGVLYRYTLGPLSYRNQTLGCVYHLLFTCREGCGRLDILHWSTAVYFFSDFPIRPNMSSYEDSCLCVRTTHPCFCDLWTRTTRYLRTKSRRFLCLPYGR